MNTAAFDVWWTLPLLIIPVIYFFTYWSQFDDRTGNSNERLRGSKGGLSKRKHKELHELIS